MKKHLAFFLSLALLAGTWTTPVVADSTNSVGTDGSFAAEADVGTDTEADTGTDAGTDTETDGKTDDGTGQEAAQSHSVLQGITCGSSESSQDYEVSLDYESKTCTMYVPEQSNNFTMYLNLDLEAGPLSGTLSYVSGASINKGTQMNRSLPMDKTAVKFANAKATATPLESSTATAQMQMELRTLEGKETWTIQVLRKTSLKALSVKSAANKTISMSGYVASSTELESESEITGDYVTLTIEPYDTGDTVYVNEDKVSAADTGTKTLTYQLALNQDRQVTTATVKSVREGENWKSQEYKLTFYRTRTDNIKTITLDQTNLDLTAENPTATVTAAVTSAVTMDSYPLTWTTEDATIATVTVDPEDVTKAVITGVSDGITEFSVSDGYVTASGQIVVEKDQAVNALADMKAASSLVVSDSTRYETSLDVENKVITIYTPAWKNGGIYMYPTFTTGKKVNKATADWTDYSGKARTGELKTNNRGVSYLYCTGAQVPYVANSAEGGSYTLTFETSAGNEVWTVNVRRYCILGGLSVTDGDGNSVALSSNFKYSIREYCLGLSTGVKTLNLTLTRGGTGDSITVNDTAVPLDEETGQGTYQLDLTAGVHKLVIQTSNGDLKSGEYVVYVYGISPTEVTFLKEPETAVVNITDASGQHQNAQDGKYYLTTGNYSYTVSAKGYQSVSGSFTVESGDAMTLKESLEAAPENTELKNFSSDWTSYSRNAGTDDNNAVIDAATPISSDSISVKWEKQLGASVSTGSTSAGIIVNDRWYGYVGDNLVVADKDTGNLLNTQKMTGTSGYQYMPPVYGDGMIFVAQSGGAVEAFNADTLEPMWRYKDSLGGTPRSQMRYDDGYLYLGFYNNPTSSTNFVCICTTDEDPTSTSEVKQATWTFSHLGGFYFSGSWSNAKYIYVSSDAGNGDTSILYGVEKATGDIVQKITINGSQRGSLVYYEGRLFLTTTGGYTYAFNLTSEGLIDTDNTIEPLFLGGRSTNTPVIYNNRLYFACAAGAVGPYKDAGIYVVDINPGDGSMSLAYSVPTEGNCQASGILSTAYFDETGYVYVYFTCNTSSGAIYMVKDKAGMTEADPASGVLWKPDHSQFCLHRLYADSSGTLYYTNDGSWTYALETTYLGLTNIQAQGGNAVVDGGAFDASASEHTILVDPDLQTLKLTFTAEEGAAVWINDQTVTEDYEVALNQGQANIKVTVVNGTNSKVYTLNVEARSKDSSLQSLYLTEDETYAETKTLTPEFTASETAYSYTYADGTTAAYLWPVAADKSSLTVTAVSGVKDCKEGEELKAVTQEGRDSYEVPFADTSQPTVVKLTVTAEYSKCQTEYVLTLNPIDHTSPVVENLTVSGRKTDCAAISFSSSEAATGYYLVTSSDGETREASYIMEQGSSFQALQGGNSIKVADLNKDQTQVQMVLVDPSGNISKVYKADIQAYIPLEGISLNVKEVSLNANKTSETLTATLNPTNPTDVPEISWTTGNEEIATVEVKEGNNLQAVITGKKSGTTTITVRAGEFSATTEVTVDVDTPKLTVTASQTEISVRKGDSFDLVFTYKTPTGSDVRALKAILTYPSDKLSIDLSKDCQVSDLKASSGFWGQNDNTYSAYTLGDSMAETGSITLTFQALGDCTFAADEISMSMELAINTASNRLKESADAKVTFAHNYVKTEKGTVCSVCGEAETVFSGDLNGDGEITNADVALLLKLVTQGESADMKVADINGDGVLTNADVAKLLGIVTSGE